MGLRLEGVVVGQQSLRASSQFKVPKGFVVGLSDSGVELWWAWGSFSGLQGTLAEMRVEISRVIGVRA